MNARINDKIIEVRRYLAELSSILPQQADYTASLKDRAAGERYFEKIAEALTDLAFLIIKENDLRQPEDDIRAFDTLVQAGFLSSELAGRLKQMKGMRNVIVHQYDSVDDRVVFVALATELPQDAAAFLKHVEKHR